jgi:hypothetical protein
MKKVFIIIGIVVLVGLAAAGGFYGGIQYQTNKVSQVQANFEQQRGQFQNGQFPGGQPPSGAAGFPGANGTGVGQSGSRNGISGQVKTLEGDVLTVSTAEDVVTVDLSADTQIQKTSLVTLTTADLQPGTRVMIIGEKDADGNISASQIMITNDMPANPASPVATEKAP